MPFKLPIRAHQRKTPSEVVAVDLATDVIKAVRMRKSKDDVSVLSVGTLPPLPEEPLFPLPKNLLCNYAAFTMTGEGALVRILNLPARADADSLSEEQVREQVGLGPEYRVAYANAGSPRGKAETRILVVGLPETEAQNLLKRVAIGAPAAVSIEVAGISAMGAFLRGPGAAHAQEAVGFIEAGSKVTFAALFNKNCLSLIRKFEFGSGSLVAKVQQQLGVDRQIAQGIVSDGSFDISQPVHEVMDPFLRQVSISKDFVERREDCRIGRFYVSGGTSLCRYWIEEIKNTLGIEVAAWNPFENLKLASDAYPTNMEGQQTRFSAAVGACLGAFDLL